MRIVLPQESFLLQFVWGHTTTLLDYMANRSPCVVDLTICLSVQLSILLPAKLLSLTVFIIEEEHEQCTVIPGIILDELKNKMC